MKQFMTEDDVQVISDKKSSVHETYLSKKMLRKFLMVMGLEWMSISNESFISPFKNYE